MNAWLSLSQYRPAAPGLYWCRFDLRTWTDAQGVRRTNYRTDWLKWDGECWQDGQPTAFYGEKPHEVKA